MESVVSEIQIFEDRQPNGQWLKSIKFRLPIIEEDMEVSLDDDEHVETVVQLYHQKSTEYFHVDHEPQNNGYLDKMPATATYLRD